MKKPGTADRNTTTRTSSSAASCAEHFANERNNAEVMRLRGGLSIITVATPSPICTSRWSKS